MVTAANPSALGGHGKVVVIPAGGSGGQSQEFRWRDRDSGAIAARRRERNWMAPFRISSKQFKTARGQETDPQLGTLSFALPANDRHWESDEPTFDVSITRFPGARYAGYVSMSSMRRRLNRFRSKHLSPIEVSDFGVGANGLFASGRILPEIEILDGGLDFLFEGGNISVYRAFEPGAFHLPAPFEVRNSSLVVSLGTEEGLGVEGQVDFGIQGAGEGVLRGRTSTGGGLEFEGNFDFDSELFTTSEMTVGYRRAAGAEEGGFYFSGELGVGPGKVRGLKSASLSVAYDEATGITAAGHGEVDFPGVQGGDFNLSYTPGQGMELRAGLDLSPDIPRITDGRIDVTVRKEGEQWSVGAGGSATLDLPGFPIDVSASYLDGVFDVSATVPYDKGMLSGSLTAGVTNQAIGEDGRPTGAAADAMSIYGSGSMTVQIAPWLQATASVTVFPDGNLKVAGEIGLPGSIDLFPRKEIAKDLFRTPSLDIPIFGTSVAGIRVGIFATVSGGMRASAGIGPGRLQELRGGIEYEPAHEENTHIYANGKFVVPVDAGLTMFVRGGIGAGVAIVSVTGGLEASGTLGLECAMEMGTQVDWRPNTGLEIRGNADIWAQPKLTFDLSGYATAEANLLFSTVTLYDERWRLASVEVGSDYRVGIHFPVEYKEGESFDVSLDDVQFTYPRINVMSTIRGLIA
jgi:hypothetical protein